MKYTVPNLGCLENQSCVCQGGTTASGSVLLAMKCSSGVGVDEVNNLCHPGPADTSVYEMCKSGDSRSSINSASNSCISGGTVTTSIDTCSSVGATPGMNHYCGDGGNDSCGPGASG